MKSFAIPRLILQRWPSTVYVQNTYSLAITSCMRMFARLYTSLCEYYVCVCMCAYLSMCGLQYWLWKARLGNEFSIRYHTHWVLTQTLGILSTSTCTWLISWQQKESFCTRYELIFSWMCVCLCLSCFSSRFSLLRLLVRTRVRTCMESTMHLTLNYSGGRWTDRQLPRGVCFRCTCGENRP